MSGGGREWSGVMEGVVRCDGGLSLMDEGWSSVVGVVGWVLSVGGCSWVGSGHLQVGTVVHGWVVLVHDGGLSFMGVGLSFVVGDHHLWMGDGHFWWGVIVHGWGVVILRWVSSSVGGHSWSSVCGASSSVGGGCHLCVGCCRP